MYLNEISNGSLTFIQKSGHVDKQKCYLKEKPVRLQPDIGLAGMTGGEDGCLKDVFAVVMTGSSNSQQ